MILFAFMLACGDKESEDTAVATQEIVDTAENPETDPQDTAAEDTAE